MSREIWVSTEDIGSHPQHLADIDPTSAVEVVLGDLHGNTMKLIYALIYYGVLVLNDAEDDYDLLFCLCSKPTADISERDIFRFGDILDKATYSNNISVVMLGDDLADRMYNDLFTLKFYQALLKHRVRYTIVLSNHGEVGLRSILSGKYFLEIGEFAEKPNGSMVFHNYQQSLTNLWALIDNKTISLSDVQDLFNEVYQPFVCVLSYYVLQEDALALYVHAPVSLVQIKNLMRQWDVIFDDSSIEQLTRGIDEVNHKYRELIQHSIYLKGPLDPLAEAWIKALEPLLWQRILPFDFTLTPTKDNFALSLLHCHVGENPQWRGSQNTADFGRLFNLDTNLGKAKHMDKGKLAAAILKRQPALANTPYHGLATQKYTLFAQADPQKEKILNAKLASLRTSIQDTKLQFDSSEPTHQLVEIFYMMIERIYNKGSGKGYQLCNRIIHALPSLRNEKALATHILDNTCDLHHELYDPIMTSSDILCEDFAATQACANEVLDNHQKMSYRS